MVTEDKNYIYRKRNLVQKNRDIHLCYNQSMYLRMKTNFKGKPPSSSLELRSMYKDVKLSFLLDTRLVTRKRTPLVWRRSVYLLRKMKAWFLTRHTMSWGWPYQTMKEMFYRQSVFWNRRGTGKMGSLLCIQYQRSVKTNVTYFNYMYLTTKAKREYREWNLTSVDIDSHRFSYKKRSTNCTS